MLPPELVVPPPPELLLFAWVCAASYSAWRRAADSAARRASSSRDELAEFGFGVDPGLLVLGGALVGVGLCVDERGRKGFGFGDLVPEFFPVVFEVVDERVEFVGAEVTGAERHLGELIALEHVVDVARVLEQRSERCGAGADEGTHGHVAEIGAELDQLCFLHCDVGFELDDLGVEGRLLVDGLDVIGCDVVRLLFESFEFVDDALDAGALLVDRARGGDMRVHRRDDERNHQRDWGNTEELLHERQLYRI